MSKLFGKRFHAGKHIGLSPFRKTKSASRKKRRLKAKAEPPMSVQMEFVEGAEGEQLFIVVDGERIAERGPNRTWVSLRPGWEVIDTDNGRSVEIIVSGGAFH